MKVKCKQILWIFQKSHFYQNLNNMIADENDEVRYDVDDPDLLIPISNE